MAIRIVFFDWGGVLAQSNTARLLRRARLTRTRRIDRLLRRACEGEFPVLEAIRRIYAGRPDESRWPTALEDSLMPDAVRPRKSAWRLARDLRRQGIRTGILSNNTIEWSWSILTRTPAARDFDPVLFSALESLHGGKTLVKPRPAIYLQALRIAKVHPSEAALLDDREENVRGARRAGMLAERYTNATAARRWLRGLGIPIPRR